MFKAATNTPAGTNQSRTFDQKSLLVQITSASTTSTFIYDGTDKRIIQNVTSGGKTTSTLYANGHEETLNSGSNSPYIVCYMFGSKTVGMRRANQPGVNANEQ
ncbi:MAG: hypothetical protein IVW55_05295 [Chloroflexi bacterium]|nr:hypothetical protein [Chloroflexota bacterium]